MEYHMKMIKWYFFNGRKSKPHEVEVDALNCLMYTVSEVKIISIFILYYLKTEALSRLKVYQVRQETRQVYTKRLNTIHDEVR